MVEPDQLRPPLQGLQVGPFALTNLIVAAVAVGMAYCVSRGLGNLVGVSQPEVVESLGIASPQASVRFSDILRTSGNGRIPDQAEGADPAEQQVDLDRAWKAAAEALQAQPLNVEALRSLGQIAQQRGRGEDAAVLMRAAVGRSIREPISNIWLANFYLAQKDYPKALDRIDALLRTTPNLSGSVLPVLTGIASTPEATSALAALLAQGPPWRAGFLNALPGRVLHATNLQDLYLKLMSSSPVLPDVELKPYLEMLIRQNHVEEAYYLWTKAIPPGELADLGYVFNGSFQQRPSGLPFDWVLTPIQGAKSEIKNYSRDDQKRALSIEFGSGGRVAFQNVTQVTLIPPGHYRLSGEYRADELANRRGMTWRLYCLESGTLLTETPRVSGSSEGWQPFETTFDVPQQNCRAQWLRLELAYRVDIEQEVSGSVWYDNIKIETVQTDGEKRPVDASTMRIQLPNAATQFEKAIQRRQ